ncbi:Phosphopantothenoylcysteine decarboxylase [Acropora cervicornis]|uniref:Phosphopantothenoylcysteine decarboxylase n=1 Tax=Acropora cervicornis TaxID=6130 RepID=A0AAD9QKF1_ACRCE|nr:Phosphopantothenoylcysteine decarboxylase [Acropora cervicornis]KAK2562964.1 Phosphopantothenoylcysteine decarboxylase [Acropora cervicornis]
MAAEISPPTKLCKNILIGVTGSVASVKLSRLVEELLLLQPKPNIQVIATDHSTHFFDEAKIPVKVYRDRHEWEVNKGSVYKLASEKSEHSQIAHSYRLYSMQSSYTRPVEGALIVTQLFNIDYETQGD